MHIHISSGNSVDEVCRALWHFLNWLEREGYRFEVLQREYGKLEDTYKSLVLESDDKRFLALTGTHLWRCQSPFRPKHKRKNWYFSLHIRHTIKSETIDESKVVYQTMKSPKKGGQHVNTTCSGVRAVYAPLGLEAVSYDERSQHKNKAIALKRLKKRVLQMQECKENTLRKDQWVQGKTVIRGRAVKIFEGSRFKEVSV